MPAANVSSETRVIRSALRTLGLDTSASWQDIRTAYARKVKQAHPDSSPGHGSRFVLEQTLQAYRLLKTSYRVDEQKRSRVSRHTRPAAAPSWQSIGRTALAADTPEERCAACSALGRTGRRSASAYLRAALYDHDDRVVVAAATALGLLKARSAARDYEGIFDSAGLRVRSSILNAAVQTGPAECFRKLFVTALSDEDRSVRRVALTGLSRLNAAAKG